MMLDQTTTDEDSATSTEPRTDSDGMDRDGTAGDATDRAGSDRGTNGPAPASDAEGADGHPRSITKDDAFHLLQTARRRAVLRYLLAHTDQQTFRMRDVAEEIAAWEHDTTVRQLTSQQRQRVYIALYQSHLPKLDDHGVIRYNQSRGVIEPTPLLAVFAPFLESGLHADTQALTRDGGRVTPTETGTRTQPDLVAGLTSLFTR